MQLAMPATGLEGRHALQGAEARAHAELCQHEHQDAALPPQHGRAYLGGEGDAAEGARAARLLLSPRLLDLSCAVRR